MHASPSAISGTRASRRATSEMLALLIATASCASAHVHEKIALRVSRRSAAAALLSLPALGLWEPAPAAALLGIGDGGPQGEFRQINKADTRLAELERQLESKELDGDKPDDAIVVLQTLTIQFGQTAGLLEKTTAAMPLLEAADLARARKLQSAFAEELEKVRQGCRDKVGSKQLEGVIDARSALAAYLAVADKKYTVPEKPADLAYSKDPREFAKQYYGFFSCEGQGLERVKGSNTCGNTYEGEKNINPFPTKQFLDFDFLTGKSIEIAK